MIVKTKIALVGLACMLKANPSVDVKQAEEGLSSEQIEFVNEVESSNACYDEKLQAMLEQTESEQQATGRTIQPFSPSRTTFSGL